MRSHLVSDVPVGAFLSGGVDSSAVVSPSWRRSPQPAHQDVLDRLPGGPLQRAALRPPGRRVAAGPSTTSSSSSPTTSRSSRSCSASFDEPFADSSAIPTYLVSRLARQHVKVVLSGDGGDELFAGYDRYVVDHRRRHLGLLGDLRLGAPLRALSGSAAGRRRQEHALQPLAAAIERYLDVDLALPASSPCATSSAATPARLGLDIASLADRDLDPLSRLQELDLKTYLPGDILTKVDRMSMANSLEARVPLLDHPLVEFACSLPPDLRMRDGTTKYLLKRALRGPRSRRGADPAQAGVRRAARGVVLRQSLRGFFRDQLGRRWSAGGRRHRAGTRSADSSSSSRRRAVGTTATASGPSWSSTGAPRLFWVPAA